jgi:hypothetical protein
MAAPTDSLRPAVNPQRPVVDSCPHQHSTTTGTTGSRGSRAWGRSLADPLHAIYGMPS